MPDNAYRPDIVTRMLITRVELITISLVIIRSIWHKSTADFFCVLENFRRKFANLVAPPTDGTTKRFVQSTSSPLTVGENSVQIHA